MSFSFFSKKTQGQKIMDLIDRSVNEFINHPDRKLHTIIEAKVLLITLVFTELSNKYSRSPNVNALTNELLTEMELRLSNSEKQIILRSYNNIRAFFKQRFDVFFEMDPMMALQQERGQVPALTCTCLFGNPLGSLSSVQLADGKRTYTSTNLYMNLPQILRFVDIYLESRRRFIKNLEPMI
jgi:hypothetical protein